MHPHQFLSEQLSLAVEQLNALAVVVARHGEKDGILEAKGALRDETLLMLIRGLVVFLANERGLRPDLIDGPRGALGQGALHGAQDHVLLFLSFVRA